MDCLINAHLQNTILCRRRVFRVHFDNSSAGENNFIIKLCILDRFTYSLLTDPDHLAYDPSCLEGCLRCAPTLPEICCDIHHPNAFSFFDTTVTLAPSKVPYCSRLTKYEMGSKEHELCDVLEDWREAATKRIYGDSNLNDYGPSLVMPNSVLERIVDCAHYKKIVTIDDLRKETQWSGVDQFGSDVITVIHRIILVPVPVPVFTSNPLQPLPHQSVDNTLNTHAHPLAPSAIMVTNRKQSRCSTCNLEGHNSKSTLTINSHAMCSCLRAKSNMYNAPFSSCLPHSKFRGQRELCTSIKLM
ncbi:hypothetical protein BD769DRAFT_1370648 [Suillus cothurnatus]|nr:hypothetical protein BD769DRAFT_1370648 [Suillus cothurnatus]